MRPRVKRKIYPHKQALSILMLELKDNDFKVTMINMTKNPREKVRSPPHSTERKQTH